MRTLWHDLDAVILTGANGSRAVVTLHGAHVVEFIPNGMSDVLFVSEKSEFVSGKAIRGGVPVCFPWFGAAPAGQSGSHGFVRNTAWELLEDNGDSAVFGFENAQFQLRYTVTVAAELTLKLQIRNLTANEFAYSGALHTYFRVGDVSRVTLDGIADTVYFDSLTGTEVRQTAPLVIDREVDRIYRSDAAVTIHDPELKRSIRIAKSGSNSTVIWNPWIDKSRRLADFGDNEYPRMLCVEAANTPATGDDRILQAHETAELVQIISVFQA
jgi:glucose-6-phosphate 1-epimerase